jgi:hypothetical protein
MMWNTVISRVVLLIRLDTAYLHEHMSSLPDFCEVCVVQSLLFCVVFCGNVCPFSYDHCIVCPSSISGCWLSYWHLQTFLYVILLVSDLHQVDVVIISRCLLQKKEPVWHNWNIQRLKWRQSPTIMLWCKTPNNRVK